MSGQDQIKKTTSMQVGTPLTQIASLFIIELAQGYYALALRVLALKYPLGPNTASL